MVAHLNYTDTKFAVSGLTSRKLTSQRLDWPRVGLSANCPVSISPTFPKHFISYTNHLLVTINRVNSLWILFVIAKCNASELSPHLVSHNSRITGGICTASIHTRLRRIHSDCRQEDCTSRHRFLRFNDGVSLARIYRTPIAISWRATQLLLQHTHQLLRILEHLWQPRVTENLLYKFVVDGRFRWTNYHHTNY